MNGFTIADEFRNLLMEGAGFEIEEAEVEETEEEETSEEEVNESDESDEVICCPLCESELPKDITNEKLYENFQDIVEFIEQEQLNEDEE